MWDAPNYGPKPLDIYSRLFDIKLAQQAEFQYHGVEGGMAWRQKIRNYFVGQCPDCEQLLNWSEAHEGVITLHEVRWLDGPTGGLALDQSAAVVAGHIWTFLGVALKGKAEAVYNTGGEERIRNGMEAWRKIYAHIVNSTKLHNMGLRDQVYQPREARQYGDVTAAINDWESTYRDFRTTGGGEMGDYELKMTMLKILPSSMRDNMLYRAMDESVPYQRFRDICVHRTAELKYLAGTHKALMAVNEPGDSGAETGGREDEDDDVLAAEMTKRGWQMVPPNKRTTFLNNRRQTERPGAAPTSKPSCVNCGSKAHSSRDCPKGRVEPADRPCWGCGKPGHQRSQCPDNPSKGRPGQRNGAARQAAEEEDELNFMCGCCEGPTPKSYARPRRQIKLADFMKNDDISENLATDDYSMGGMGENPDVRSLTLTSSNVHGDQLGSKFDFRSLDEYPSLPRLNITTPLIRDRAARNEQRMHAYREFGSVTGAMGVPSDEEPSETLEPEVLTSRRPSSRLEDVPPMTSLVCAEEELDTPIFEVDDEEFEELILTITADSGAGNHITNKDDIGGYAKLIQPSPGSLAGKGFIAADNKKIMNEGQVSLRLQGEQDGDQLVNSMFQVADVNRPLMSIGKICDSGHRVTFESDKAEVISKRTGKVVMTFVRKNGGLYTADLILRTPKKPAKSKDFGRHGR